VEVTLAMLAPVSVPDSDGMTKPPYPLIETFDNVIVTSAAATGASMAAASVAIVVVDFM
jgi:hypothetical protein